MLTKPTPPVVSNVVSLVGVTKQGCGDSALDRYRRYPQTHLDKFHTPELSFANRAERQSRSRAYIVNLHFCASLWLKGDLRLSRVLSSCSDSCGRVVQRSVPGYCTSCTLRVHQDSIQPFKTPCDSPLYVNTRVRGYQPQAQH